MSLRLLRSSGYGALPWKNGLGVSQVIASLPPGAGYAAVQWQVGTTAITASCPFSSLAGFDRHFMLLEGEGVELHCRSAEADPEVRRRVDTPLEPFAFRGDWQTDCVLIGAPVRVFNVMTRRACFAAEVSTLTSGKPATLEKGSLETLLVFVAGGTIQIDVGSVSVATNDAIIADGPEPGRYSVTGTSAHAVIVRLFPIG